MRAQRAPEPHELERAPQLGICGPVELSFLTISEQRRNAAREIRSADAAHGIMHRRAGDPAIQKRR